MVGADRELVLGEDHPVGLDAAELGLAELVPSGITAPGLATATVWPAATFGAPQTICDGVAVADVDQADAEPVGVGVLVGLEHLADDEVLERADAVVLDRARPRCPVIASRSASACGVERRAAVLVQPLERDAHQPNCSRKRTSLS